MPVSFLTPAQRERFGRYPSTPSADELARYFQLDDADLVLISQKRGDHNRLGFALPLTTVRFLGTFLENPLDVPVTVLSTLSRQLAIPLSDHLDSYRDERQHQLHVMEIRTRYGYRDFTDQGAGLHLTRWLYALCGTGTDRPSVLFERATDGLLSHKVLLPGVSVLERFVAKRRTRVEKRLWNRLGRGVTEEQQRQLENLLIVPAGSRRSPLDQLRSGPVTVSGPGLVRAILRLQSVRDLGMARPAAVAIPPSRLALLARFAAAAKVSVIQRLPAARRLATLVAFVQSLEATAQDDALEILEMLRRNLFAEAMKADRTARLRTLKDLDQAALTLAEGGALLLDATLPDSELRSRVFVRLPPTALTLPRRPTARRTRAVLRPLIQPVPRFLQILQQLDRQHPQPRLVQGIQVGLV